MFSFIYGIKIKLNILKTANILQRDIKLITYASMRNIGEREWNENENASQKMWWRRRKKNRTEAKTKMLKKIFARFTAHTHTHYNMNTVLSRLPDYQNKANLDALWEPGYLNVSKITWTWFLSCKSFYL